MYDLQRLRALAELHRLGTVTAAAESMRYTHSAVSQQLTALEREAGVALYEKHGRRLRLTEQGVILAEYAHRVLALIDEAQAELAASTSQVAGTVRVTSFQTVLSSMLPQALTELRERYPNLHVEVVQRPIEQAMEELLRREVDLVLGEEYDGEMPITSERMHREPLLEDPQVLITPKTGPWSTLEFANLAGVPFAVDPEYLVTGRFVHALAKRSGFSPNVAFETPDPFLQAHLVRTGHAVAVVSDMFLQYVDGVRVAGLPGNPTRTLFTAVLEGRARHPALVAVREALTRAVPRAGGPVG